MSGIPDIQLNHQRFQSPPRYPSAPAPMAIPRAQERPVPPPLPPPSYIPISPNHDPGWQWGNDPNGLDFGRPASVKPGSSLLGGAPARTFSGRVEKESDATYSNTDWARRGSAISTATTATITGNNNDMAESGSLTPSDDGSMSRPSSNYRLHGERHLEQRTLEASSNTYDKQLLSRIGGPNGPPTPKRTSLSYSAGNMQETARLAHAETERRNSQLLRPLTMPERPQQSSLDSPASSRWPPSGAISPGFTGFWAEHGSSEHNRFQPSRHSSITFEDSISQRGSYDASMYMHEDLMEDRHMRDLNLQDRSPGSDDYARTGQKRRASSPPRDLSREDRSSVSSASAQSEIVHRRSIQQLPRVSPISRLHPNHSSISSASSYGPRHGSLGSSLGVLSIPSSAATSYASGRISPGALSPAFDPSEGRTNPHFTHNKGLSPNSAIAPHQRTLSQSSQGTLSNGVPDSAPQSRNPSVSHLHGVYICECCPKKPKKFDTEDDLRLHESEKQYTCAYCPNRFKNKNEAERHQNSLHLRRHSWSCAALAGVEAAFHSSSTGSGHDVCGYCGEEYPNPPQWDLRAEHLNHVHKFGECNQAKKFFRADHFRQHLKHSHQGTSGKWTNMLELACMKDEPLPEKRAVTQAGHAPPPALMVSTDDAASGSPGGPGVTPGESS
ncbi:putative Zinc finger C2H2-type [Septoria linicola]|nr:putative Zinc finger C2H2-type [Septoria linicola]